MVGNDIGTTIEETTPIVLSVAREAFKKRHQVEQSDKQGVREKIMSVINNAFSDGLDSGGGDYAGEYGASEEYADVIIELVERDVIGEDEKHSDKAWSNAIPRNTLRSEQRARLKGEKV